MTLVLERVLPTRRQLLSGAFGAGALVALGACGNDGSPASADRPAAPSGPFRWTDSRGRRIALPKKPTRIVAQVGAAAALWDLGVRPIGVFGPSKKPDGGQDPQSGSVDLSAVTSLGNEWDEFNVERYLGLRPELLVSVANAGELWYVPTASAAQIEKIAPTVGVAVDDAPLPTVIERFVGLATALGADVNAPSVDDAKLAYQKADRELADAVRAAKSAGLRVGAVTVLDDVLYLAVPKAFANLRHFADQGMPFVRLTAADEYWEGLSWENANKYPLDVILCDTRTQSTPAAALVKQHPTWARLPAVEAGQVLPWYSEAHYSYQGYLTQFKELAAGLRDARRVA